MEIPAVSITYFQISFQIVHVYHALRSECFQKSGGCLNLMSVFSCAISNGTCFNIPESFIIVLL